MKKSSYSLLFASILMVIINPILIFFTTFFVSIGSTNLLAIIDPLLYFFFINITILIISAILGIWAFRNPKRANACFIAGNIYLVSNIIQLIMLHSSDLVLFSFILTSIIPFIYTISAYLFKKHSKQENIEDYTL